MPSLPIAIAPLLLLCPLLAAAAPKVNDMLPDEPGSFKVQSTWQLGTSGGGAAEDERAVGETMDRIVSILGKTDTLRHPRGVHVRVDESLGPAETLGSCTRKRVSGWLQMVFYYLSVGVDLKPVWGGGANQTLDVWVNSGPLVWSAFREYSLPDGRPIETGDHITRVGAVTLYGPYVVFRPGGGSPWVPVTREQLLEAAARSVEAAMAKGEAARAAAPTSSDRYEKWLAGRDERKRALDAATASLSRREGPEKAAEWRRNAERTEAAMDENMRKLASAPAPKSPTPGFQRDALAAIRAELAAMPASERSQDAWVSLIPRKDNPYRLTLVAPGTVRSAPAVAVDPELLQCSRVPGEIRHIVMKFGVPRPTENVSMLRMWELLRSAQLEEIGTLLRSR
jgi:hypothetical protein